MKASLLLATLSLALAAAVSAQAQTPAPAAPAPMDFATHKAQLVARLDQRVAAATAMRDCVNAANSPDDLKGCRKMARRMHHQHAPA